MDGPGSGGTTGCTLSRGRFGGAKGTVRGRWGVAVRWRGGRRGGGRARMLRTRRAGAVSTTGSTHTRENAKTQDTHQESCRRAARAALGAHRRSLAPAAARRRPPRGMSIRLVCVDARCRRRRRAGRQEAALLSTRWNLRRTASGAVSRDAEIPTFGRERLVDDHGRRRDDDDGDEGVRAGRWID